MARSAFGAAYRVNFQFQIFQTKVLKNLYCQQDNFCINVRTLNAQCFDTELMELTVTTSLGTVITEHRSNVEQFGGSRFCVKFMLDVSTNCGSGVFRTQGKASFTTIGKSVHFLFYNVGGFTNATQEQLSVFKHGSSNFFVAILSANFAHGIFKVTPRCNICRHDVFSTSRCRSQHADSSYSLNSNIRFSPSCWILLVYVNIFFGILNREM